MQWCEGQNEKMMLMKGWEPKRHIYSYQEETFRLRQDEENCEFHLILYRNPGKSRIPETTEVQNGKI